MLTPLRRSAGRSSDGSVGDRWAAGSGHDQTVPHAPHRHRRPRPREQLLAFPRPRHRALLTTRRSDGSPQLSPVAAGVDAEGRVVVSTYPQRAEVRDVQRDLRVSLCFLSDDWDGARVQVDGRAEVLAPPEALDASVDDDRGIAGEHPDWDDYRAAMVRQGKVLLRVTVERWGPVATVGFPPEVAAG